MALLSITDDRIIRIRLMPSSFVMWMAGPKRKIVAATGRQK